MSDVERALRDVVGELPRPDEETMRALEPRVVALRARRPREWKRQTGAVAVLACVAVGVAALIGATANASGGDAFADAPADPTLAVRKYESGGATRLDLSGRIPSEKAGEYVEVLERECGSRFFRISTGASTVDGGFWSKNEVVFFTTVTYVARWNGRLSEEVTVRSPLYVLPLPLPKRRWRIMVNTRLQSMVGRTIVLQRKTAEDTWERVRTAKLRRGSTFGTYETIVPIPTHGLTVRIFVPQASARPCHDAAVSPSWAS